MLIGLFLVCGSLLSSVADHLLRDRSPGSSARRREKWEGQLGTSLGYLKGGKPHSCVKGHPRGPLPAVGFGWEEEEEILVEKLRSPVPGRR